MREGECERGNVVLLPLALAVTNEVTLSSKAAAHLQDMPGTLGY